MADSERLLELIERGVVEHGGDLGGRTRLSDGALAILNDLVGRSRPPEKKKPRWKFW